VRFGSLFAGVGGFDLGLERAGMEPVWQVEIDRFNQRVLTTHWPEVQHFKDVRDVGKAELASVDLISGGFPCQDLSVAGNRAGLAGERSGLFHEFARIVGELAPRWVLIENVPGLLSSWTPIEPPPFEIPTRDFGSEEEARKWADSVEGQWDVEETSDLETVTATLGELGYWWAYRIFDSQYFGVAQRRCRVFIVGHSRNRAYPAKVLFEPESLPGNPAPREKARQGLAKCVTTGTRMDSETETFVAEAIGTLKERAYKGPNAEEAADGQLVAAFSAGQSAKAGSLGYREEQSPTLRGAPSGTNQVPSLLWEPRSPDGVHRMNSDGICPTLNTAQGGQRQPCVGVRRLTPRECERLQGFPDDFTAIDGEDTPDSPRYRAMGNAVTVPVIEWIGRRIMAVESGVAV